MDYPIGWEADGVSLITKDSFSGWHVADIPGATGVVAYGPRVFISNQRTEHGQQKSI